MSGHGLGRARSAGLAVGLALGGRKGASRARSAALGARSGRVADGAVRAALRAVGLGELASRTRGACRFVSISNDAHSRKLTAVLRRAWVLRSGRAVGADLRVGQSKGARRTGRAGRLAGLGLSRAGAAGEARAETASGSCKSQERSEGNVHADRGMAYQRSPESKEHSAWPAIPNSDPRDSPGNCACRWPARTCPADTPRLHTTSSSIEHRVSGRKRDGS